MSTVTDVIITLSLIEEDSGCKPSPAMLNINSYLCAKSMGCFNRIDDCAGGRKTFQAQIWAGAFNHLNIEELLNTVASQSWEDRESVQIFVKEEGQDTFALREI